MKKLICQNNSSGASSPFMVTDCLRKTFTGINVADSVSEKITYEKQSPLIWRQVVWRNYIEQMTEKQNSVNSGTLSLKNKIPTIYGNHCSFDQKTKKSPNKVGYNQLESYISGNLLF